MKVAAVVIEPWKQSVFERELKADGFEFESNPPGEIAGEPVVVIQVKCDRESQLEPTVRRAQAAARKVSRELRRRP